MSEPRMNGEIKGDSMDEVFRDLLFYLTKYPDYVCSPRGQMVKEQLATTLVLTDPQRRLITAPSREANYGFSVGEFLWYWQGKDDLETMLYYNKRMKDFSDDGVTLNSAYGKRLRGHTIGTWNEERPFMTQWEVAQKTLFDDPDSRRCVLHINRPADQYTAVTLGSKDVPCTMALQFFIRGGRLHLHVTMRSNDSIWGLTSDVFSFTLLQECMLRDLQKHARFRDLRLGTYYHTAGSLHIYERHFDMADRILKDYEGRKLWAEPMGDVKLEQLEDLCRLEEDLRLGRIDRISLSNFDGGVAWMSDMLNQHRLKRDAEKAKA